jgi:hypothetical protein
MTSFFTGHGFCRTASRHLLLRSAADPRAARQRLGLCGAAACSVCCRRCSLIPPAKSLFPVDLTVFPVHGQRRIRSPRARPGTSSTGTRDPQRQPDHLQLLRRRSPTSLFRAVEFASGRAKHPGPRRVAKFSPWTAGMGRQEAETAKKSCADRLLRDRQFAMGRRIRNSLGRQVLPLTLRGPCLASTGSEAFSCPRIRASGEVFDVVPLEMSGRCSSSARVHNAGRPGTEQVPVLALVLPMAGRAVQSATTRVEVSLWLGAIKCSTARRAPRACSGAVGLGASNTLALRTTARSTRGGWNEHGAMLCSRRCLPESSMLERPAVRQRTSLAAAPQAMGANRRFGASTASDKVQCPAAACPVLKYRSLGKQAPDSRARAAQRRRRSSRGAEPYSKGQLQRSVRPRQDSATSSSRLAAAFSLARRERTVRSVRLGRGNKHSWPVQSGLPCPDRKRPMSVWTQARAHALSRCAATAALVAWGGGGGRPNSRGSVANLACAPAVRSRSSRSLLAGRHSVARCLQQRIAGRVAAATPRDSSSVPSLPAGRRGTSRSRCWWRALS